MVGNTYTSSGIFDSLSFIGLQLSSDKEMLPDSLHGFAPTIRGIARTTAEVSVYQNGYSIYKTTVAPGAFEINDLYATAALTLTCTSTLKSLTAASKTLWCLSRRWRSCNVRASWTMR